MSPISTANLFKCAQRVFNLPNRILLPKGSVCDIVIHPAQLANPHLDRPAELDLLRYHKLRASFDGNQAGAARRWEWGCPTRDDISFGYGAHQCPGRLLGCSMIKMFLIKLLTQYRVKPGQMAGNRDADIRIGQYVRVSVACLKHRS